LAFWQICLAVPYYSTEVHLLLPKDLLDFSYIGVSWLAAIPNGHGGGHSSRLTGDETVGYQADQIGHAQIATDASSDGKDIVDSLWD
jgi:hypothetical protein